MSRLVYGDVISRIKEKLKATNQDSFITDRMCYSYLKPWLSQTMRELDGKNKLMAFSSLFTTLDSVPLIEVDTIEAGCTGLQSGYKIMRTKDSMEEMFMEAYWGSMIREVTSLDGSEQLQPITAGGYLNLSKLKTFKYNKTLYYWELNGHLYFPNIPWPAVRIVALTEEDISKYKCNSDEECLTKQEQSFNVPDFILARAESLMFQSMGITLQIPADLSQDNRNNNRT